MAKLIRGQAWAHTPIGPIESWSPALRMMVRLLLVNRFPQLLWWGPDYISIYNDAYIPILGAKHPWGLGKPVRECWSEIWHLLQPLIDTPFGGGPSTWNDDFGLELNRHGFLEEAHFTIAYSPVPDETAPGGIGGVLATVNEITEKVVGERRVITLRDLGTRIGDAKTAEDACANAAGALAAHAKDISFALIYLIEASGTHARLAGAAGIEPGEQMSPVLVKLGTDSDAGWPFARTLANDGFDTVPQLQLRFGRVPGGPWSDPPATAAVMSIPSPKVHEPAGLIVVGLSARLKFDQFYREFLELVRTRLATAIASARAYEEERKRAEALAEIDRAKTVFFSNVSHEFRTPLTLILGPVDDSLSDTDHPLPIEQRQRLELIRRNGLRLQKLVNTLLDFSRIEAGRAQASFVPTDLSTLTIDLASSFRSAAEKAGLTLTVDCPALPGPVDVDPSMWEKIVLNLLSNAFKFTFEGTITVTQRFLDGHIELVVADTGTGIPAGELPRIFERFRRVEGAHGRSHEGTGIGLALVRELIKQHGGTIEAESLLGAGSTFRVTIPARRADRADRPAKTAGTAATEGFLSEIAQWQASGSVPPASATSPAHAFTAASPARVLVVDDNADMRSYLCRMLEREYQVEGVSDGRAALDQIRANPPDLVLTDVMMPRLDGLGLVAAVRAEPFSRAIPVILLSARAGEEARIEGLKAGADEYLVKPFGARELLASVASQLQLARVRRDSEQALRLKSAQFEALNDVGAIVASNLDRQTVVQAVTDAATQLTTAAFGAFFYNVKNEAGESQTLYTISGVPRETFCKFPMPRNTAVLEPAFKGTDVVRSADITTDSRPGHSEPHHGTPLGHLPVRSYLAVPVKGRSAEVIGGLFFGHPEVGRFSEQHERLAVGVASWAAVALENASLFASVQEASRLKDEFLASLSHELRTPLNAILGYARMLRAGIVAPERQHKAIETIERNATSLTQIVEDVLDISRIVSGKTRLNVQSVDFPEIVRGAIDAIIPAADARGVRVESVLDPRAGSISGDPERLQQVLWNLLSNAVKFTDRGGKVQVRLERIESHVQVTVSDTGIGISPDFLPHVFERFRQADAAITRERGGLGLGLSIARQLTEMHGGTIVVSSGGVGRGATFRLKVPLMIVHPVPNEVPRVSPSMEQRPPRIPDGELQHVRVLAIDDEPDSLSLVAELLEASGARVKTAPSATEGLAALEGEAPDVVVVDLGMPFMDGFQFIDRVRRHTDPRIQSLPVAALTAYARSGDRMKAFQAGFNVHLAKPIDPAELVTAVGALARRFRASLPDAGPSSTNDTPKSL
jgi:signal transduction histidine kinase/DNA-binding response OmpR family regulator